MTIDAELGWLLDGFGEGCLLIHCCGDCGAFSEPKAVVCPVCGSVALRALAASGQAQVVSWTTTHERRGSGGGENRTFVIAQLEEGPWWWGEAIGAGADELSNGDELRVAFRRGPEGQALPVFCVAGRTASP